MLCNKKEPMDFKHAFALLKYFYSFTLHELNNLSMRQFFMYLEEYNKIRELTMGIGDGKDPNDQIMAAAQSVGILTPSRQ